MAEYNPRPLTDPTFDYPTTTTEVAYADISRWKDPLMAHFHYAHGAKRQDFDRQASAFYAPIQTELNLTNTKREWLAKQELWAKSQADRKVFEQATLGQMFLAAPLNAANIPYFRLLKGANMLSSVGNAAVTGGVISTSEEVLRASVLPDYDPREGAFNIATTTALGTAFVAGGYTGKKAVQNLFDSSHRRFNQHSQTITEMERFIADEARLKETAKKSNERVNLLKSVGLNEKSSTEALRNTSISLNQRIEGNLRMLKDDSSPLSVEAKSSVLEEINGLVGDRRIIIDEINMRRLDEGLSQIDDPWGIATSFFDFVDIMPTPLKSITKYKIPKTASKELKSAINNLKRTSILMAGDSSMLFAGQKLGLTLPPSVHIQNQLRKADVVNLENQLTTLWKDATDAPRVAPNVARRLLRSAPTLDEWIDTVNIKRIKNDQNMSPKEAEAAQLLTRYYNTIRDEGELSGVLGSGQFIESRIQIKKLALNTAKQKLAKHKQAKFQQAIDHFKVRVKQLEEEVNELQNSLDFINKGPIRPSGADEPYFLRQWNVDKIAKDERGSKELRRILTDYVRRNPYGIEYNNKSGLYEPKDLTGNIPAQDAYVDSVIRSILSDNDVSRSATSRSTNYPSRSIAIGNAEVIDFINTNAREVARTYTMRIGTKIDFAKQFGNRTYNDLADEVFDDLIENGMLVRNADELRKNLTILYQRITATTLSDPSSLSNRVVQFLKEFTSLNYLGGAGQTAIGDIPKIVMENSFKDLFKGAIATFDSAAWQRQLKEVQTVYAEALELSLGVVQQKILEDTGSQVGSKAWSQIKDLGFILNGLGPMTVGLKSLSGSLSVHRFLDIAKRVSDGSVSKFDLEYMARYGLTPKHMKEIIRKAPIEQTPNKLNIANITDWPVSGVSADTISAFRAAVSSSVGNTILSSSPATRFTYADGSIFLRINTARKFLPNIQEDPDFKGYARFESGIMTLPFQFYNYSMSALTNILQTTAQGQTKSRFAGFATMIGMGYMIAKLKTPEWAWNDMSYDERFAAAVERSGIASIYGDIALNSIRVSVQLGLNDPENDYVNLPFYGKEGYLEAATTILGAGASSVKDFADASTKMASGDYADAVKEFYLMLPLAELFWIKDDSRAMIDYATKSVFETR